MTEISYLKSFLVSENWSLEDGYISRQIEIKFGIWNLPIFGENMFNPIKPVELSISGSSNQFELKFGVLCSRWNLYTRF